MDVSACFSRSQRWTAERRLRLATCRQADKITTRAVTRLLPAGWAIPSYEQRQHVARHPNGRVLVTLKRGLLTDQELHVRYPAAHRSRGAGEAGGAGVGEPVIA